MRVVIFGAGQYYQKRKSVLSNQDIVAFIDNNSELWGMEIDGITVFSPGDILSIHFDVIILMSAKANQMKQQLLGLGIDEEKIFYYEQFYGSLYKNTFWEFRHQNLNEENIKKEKIAILTPYLDYSGSSVAVTNLAKSLKKKYDVVLTASFLDKRFVEELNYNGLNVKEYRNLEFVNVDELGWLDEYKYILVNTLLLIRCTEIVSKTKKVIWWIHEAEVNYERVLTRFGNIREKDFKNAQIVCVSNLSRRIFKKYYQGADSGILPVAIADTYTISRKKDEEKFVFAIIGGISENKSQLFFLKAVQLLKEFEKRNVEFWIIGSVLNTTYAEQVKYMASLEPGVKLLGIKSREEMEDIYPQIDVVVCASKEETLSLAIVEGMMYKKICITTDTTGIAEYITDGQNGFICESENEEALREKMSWVLEHRTGLDSIKSNARKTYEDNFSPIFIEKKVSDMFRQ